MKKVALYTFFDDNFFECGFTMLYSFLTTNKWFNGDIFIISDNGENCMLSEENFQKIKLLYNKTYRHKVDVSVYSGVFNNFPGTTRNFLKACFYKCEIFKKDDYDVKFYVDSDICFNGNVEELFGEAIECSNGIMCRDCASTNYQSKEICQKTDEDYANMGLIVINGKNINETSFADLIRGCQNIKPDGFKNKRSFKGFYAEQDCLNEFVKGIILFPATIYNASALHVNESNFKDVKIFHYYGLKPWCENLSYFAFYVWYKYHFFAMEKLKELERNKK